MGLAAQVQKERGIARRDEPRGIGAPLNARQLANLAAEERIPVSGITILGGKPYINVTGLDVKLRTKVDEEKLVHVGTEYIEIQRADNQNGQRAGGWGIVTLFDKVGFEKGMAVAAKAGAVTKDVIETLRDMFYHRFKMRGWASPASVSMASMKVIDNIEAMAERRATNRAKREATGTGLTSVDEMDEGGEDAIPTEAKVTETDPTPTTFAEPPPAPGRPAPTRTIEAPPPQPPADPPPAPATQTSSKAGKPKERPSKLTKVGIIEVRVSSGEGDVGPWTRYGIYVIDANRKTWWVNTFDTTFGAIADDLQKQGSDASIAYVAGRITTDKRTGKKKQSYDLSYIEPYEVKS